MSSMTNSCNSKKSQINAVKAYECLDSRGFPTVAVEITLADGSVGSAMVPSGASTGEYEALELRDGDKARYQGKGVLQAVKNINEKLASKIIGMNALDLAKLDSAMIALDGTENKGSVGANAILGISLAASQAAARHLNVPLFMFLGGARSKRLPVPLVNVINGGAHASNSLDFQEFMLVPHGSTRFSELIRSASEVFHTLKKNLQKKGLSVGIGDEGGFAPNFKDQEEAMQSLCEAITDAGYQPGKDISIALDVASSELFDDESGKYIFKKGSGEKYSSSDLIALYDDWSKKYPLVSIEDGLDENDWAGWKDLTSKLGNKLQLVGDDLFVTNTKILQRGINEKAGNAILIKLNQIGSVSETLAAIQLAHDNSYNAVISHRSGETEDTCIADLAVATNAGQIKTGSVCRSERTAKYNRLIWIENFLGDAAYVSNPFKK